MKRRVLFCLLAGLLMITLTGCAAAGAITKPAPEEGKEVLEADGSCEAALRDGGTVLRISGKSNLMDGTNGVLSVLGADGIKLAEHRFTLEDGAASWDFDVGSDWPAVVYGFMSFGTQNMDAQPREVTEEYGKRFQNLTGPAVIWDNKGVIAVFQSEEVRLREADA